MTLPVVEHRIEKLRDEARRLQSLLDDPHPGLLTWMQAVAVCRREIDAIMDGERD